MALIDKIFGTKKSLSELSRQELRREEILLTKQRDRLFKKIGDISTHKQKIFQQGAAQKSSDLRKALAQDFELKTQEQLMAARELNLRSKELMTIWNDLDRGAVKETEAFEQADQAVRKRNAALDKEM